MEVKLDLNDEKFRVLLLGSCAAHARQREPDTERERERGRVQRELVRLTYVCL